MSETNQNWRCTPTAGHERHGQSTVFDELRGSTVAIIYDGKAHGNLIAAAPGLLFALREIVNARNLKMGPSAVKLRYELAKDAIAKAEGRS